MTPEPNAFTAQFDDWIAFQTKEGWPVCILSYLREHPDHVGLGSAKVPGTPTGSDWESVANYMRIRPVLERSTLKGPVFGDLFVSILGAKVGNAFTDHFRDGLDKIFDDYTDITLARHEPATVQVLNEPYEVMLGKSRGPTDLMNKVCQEMTIVPRASTIFDGTAARPEKRFTIPVGYCIVAILAMEANRTREALFEIFQREKLWIHGLGAKAKFATVTNETFAYWDLFGYYFDGVNRAIEFIADTMPPELTVMAIRLLNRQGFDDRVKG